MDTAALIRDIGQLVTIIVALVAVWRTFRFAPHETQGMDATATKSLQEAAAMAGKQASDAFVRCDELARKLDALESETMTQQTTIEHQQKIIERLQKRESLLLTENKKLNNEIFELNLRIKVLENQIADRGLR